MPPRHLVPAIGFDGLCFRPRRACAMSECSPIAARAVRFVRSPLPLMHSHTVGTDKKSVTQRKAYPQDPEPTALDWGHDTDR